MRHFSQLPAAASGELFHRAPAEFDRDSSHQVLAHALGATLYVPGTRDDLAEVIERRVAAGVRSMVIDLEDAVRDDDLAQAEDNTVRAIARLSARRAGALLFVRTRVPEQIPQITEHLGKYGEALTGFVAPKFTPANAVAYLDATAEAAQRSGSRMFLMPVLETPDLLYRETREPALQELRDILTRNRDQILCLRLGATDLCGLYGIRRDRDLSIYEVQIVADLIGDLVNHFGRMDGTGHVISGPVWEYFRSQDRLMKPRLRASPFELLRAGKLRDRLLKEDLDGLIREIVLDRSNGLTGKTVIHPTHVPVVHAMSTVSHEEYVDAQAVLAAATPSALQTGSAVAQGGSSGGVAASQYRNKMNEFRPHRRWAERIMLRAEVFGVLAPGVTVPRLLAAVESV
ncbi:HpcH/HpaI aldolase/citrate lyase family protein [Nakamurella sp. A5-74]|uniref:HpcH/HpaI aldolase/citrate lyase family protein n=1 Tax=Nakamurella sp. A5-74 TaxID=3158264 RepID=A0AAU8DNQ9_9ACTN